MKKVLLFLFSICLLSAVHVQAQTEPQDSPLIFDTYQIFLNESIKTIKRLEYESIDDRLKGYLIDDKTGIILENYDGKHRVKITYIDENGAEQKLLKSKCYIDPVIPL